MLKRATQACAVLFMAVTMLGAGSSGTRFDKLGHKLMCTCSCGEILLECNHMGCPDSPGLIAKLNAEVNAGATDHDIFQAFEKEYGAIVLAAPIRGGFDLVAWIVPFAVLAAGIVAATWLLRHWRERHIASQALAGSGQGLKSSDTPFPPTAVHVRDRIRQETGDSSA